MVGGWCPRKEWLRNSPKEFIKRMDKRMHVNVSRANDDKDEKIGYLEYDRVDSLLTRMMLMCMLCCKQKQIIRNTSSLNYTDSLFETPISIKEGASLAKFRRSGAARAHQISMKDLSSSLSAKNGANLLLSAKNGANLLCGASQRWTLAKSLISRTFLPFAEKVYIEMRRRSIIRIVQLLAACICLSIKQHSSKRIDLPFPVDRLDCSIA